MASIYRPLQGRTEVRIPYKPAPGNREMLKRICGENTRPSYNSSTRCYEVAREHLPALIDQLPDELGMPVDVTLQGAAQTKCVEACWNARPETIWNCECSCAGRYHGAGTGPRLMVREGLAVETDYTTHTFTAYPRT
jgi:hypothetical protein